jgi:hypothetical protein
MGKNLLMVNNLISREGFSLNRSGSQQYQLLKDFVNGFCPKT